MLKVMLKFLKDKGSVKRGYIGAYEKEQAATLIASGVAQEHRVIKSFKVKTKEKK